MVTRTGEGEFIRPSVIQSLSPNFACKKRIFNDLGDSNSQRNNCLCSGTG